jgi:hypothetical protein
MGSSRVGPQATREYLGRMRERYARADRPGRSRLLDEVCEVTGYHRKAVIRLLRRPRSSPRRRRPGRAVQYGPALVTTLRRIWAAAGYPWSVRLKALLPTWLPWARRRWQLSEEVARKLLAISPRQIDRCLHPFKSELRKRQYGRTKPGTLVTLVAEELADVRPVLPIPPRWVRSTRCTRTYGYCRTCSCLR